MIGMDVRVDYHNAFTADLKGATVPMRRVAEMAWMFIAKRVPKGIAADGGQFSQYKVMPPAPLEIIHSWETRSGMVKSKRAPHPQFLKGYWVPPDKPQPPQGRLVVVERGRWRGWAKYRSYRDWKSARGIGGKNFADTGQLWRSMFIHGISPLRFVLKFKGSRYREKSDGDRKKLKWSNAKLSGFLFNKEQKRPMELSSSEVAKIEKFIADTVDARLLDALKVRQVEFEAYKAVKTAERKLKQAEKAFRAAKNQLDASRWFNA